MKLNNKPNSSVLDIDTDLDEIISEYEAQAETDSDRIGPEPIVPDCKNFADFLIWATFAKAVGSVAPEALQSGLPWVTSRDVV